MRLDGVGRRYGVRGPWVLRNIDLDLPRRSLVRLEGHNGSGKSTLLRIVAGIDAPSRGRVTGRPRSAYVPERFPAALPFTAVGYLTHLGRIHGLRGPAAARRATDWLERFGAGGHARTPLAELSKGTSQKVALTQALLADPELLVLDEAWTGLDPAARDVLDRTVAERVAAGGTVVFVDHDPRRLAGAADARYRVTGDGLDRLPDRAGTGTDVRPAVAGTDVRLAVAGMDVRPADAGTDARPAEDGARPPGLQVIIEAEGPGATGHPTPRDLADLAELPGRPYVTRGPDSGTTVRLAVAAAHSDALLRALLAAHPPWHIRAVAPAPPAPPPAAPVPDETRYP
ncbi:ATP-binding cassette domain-containing protein [Streptomyces paromomycinus]|uniref:ABC transporter ATP-binding protein n=1 Tax=Streptomyces paromomycinus TaxID=92743 RepID=A0A401VYL3_STREY|nr:ATP-binding cassette domain-containing protein [Streptomyces paromomycinus]GCD42160.1 ABC transporter ATP-binding protein [Streptomyces paromomycinus]